MISIYYILSSVIDLFVWSLIIYVILNALANFGVVNRYNTVVNFIQTSLAQIHEPILYKIRSFLPNFGMIDLSPLALFVLVEIFRVILRELLFRI
mgnify:FL=1|tara:strand:+ start:150 stop:434 length:285 start_codon:yes stop_codon:yes gene_type:complete